MIIQRQVYQKEFGIVSDIYHSGVKRAWKKGIGRARKSIANKIESSAEKDIDKLSNVVIPKYQSLSSVQNKGVERSILKGIHNNGGRTISSNTIAGQDAMIRADNKLRTSLKSSEDRINDLRKSYPNFNFKSEGRTLNKLKNASNKNKYLVSYTGEGVEGLAHEAGHGSNYLGENGFLKKIISNLDSSKRFGVRGELAVGTRTTGKGLKGISKELIGGKLMKMEEKNATKSGLKKLKESGATKEELNAAKEKLKAAGETYNMARKARLKQALANTINIPSKVNNSINYSGSETAKNVLKQMGV